MAPDCESGSVIEFWQCRRRLYEQPLTGHCTPSARAPRRAERKESRKDLQVNRLIQTSPALQWRNALATRKVDRWPAGNNNLTGLRYAGGHAAIAGHLSSRACKHTEVLEAQLEVKPSKSNGRKYSPNGRLFNYQHKYQQFTTMSTAKYQCTHGTGLSTGGDLLT
jgi:hypothetical protein